MNKILTQTGGQPVFLDDIDFSSQATRDAFKALCRALSLDDIGTCILQGCDVTISGTQYTWTEGYIAIKGEIYKVDAGTINSMRLPSWVVKKNKTENRTFEDESNKPVWEVSYATLSGTYDSDDEFVLYFGAKKYKDILLEHFWSYQEIDVPLQLLNSGLDVKMQIKQYVAFKKIIVEITELPDFEGISEGSYIFRFDKKYYTENVIITSFLRKSPSYYWLSIYKDPYYGPCGGLIPLNNATLIKGFGSLKFQIII